MGAYQQIDVLTALVRLSKRTELAGVLFSSKTVDRSAFGPEVFISYGGPDAAFAKRLAKDIEAAGVRVWFAEWDLAYGDDIVQEINNALKRTGKFVIVLSPEALERPWVNKEISSAFHQALNGPGKMIVPVMLRTCDPPPFVDVQKWVNFMDEEHYTKELPELTRQLKGRKPPRT